MCRLPSPPKQTPLLEEISFRAGKRCRRQEPPKVQRGATEPQELRDALFLRALEEASAVMISDYCKKEWEGLFKVKKKTSRRHCLSDSVCGERDAVGEIEKDRINLGEAICCLNDVANVPRATDELNISLI